MPRFPTLLALAVLSASTLTAAIETWTDADGRPMQAELIAVKGSYAIFKKADGTQAMFPLAKLSAADRSRISAQPDTGAPSAKPDGDAPRPAQAFTKIASQLSGRLVSVQRNTLVPLPQDHLAGTKVYAIYFSAQWCPPCRGFTPELVRSYQQIKAAHPEFELIFVSNDRSEAAMLKYMADYGMPWAALRFREVRGNRTLNAYREDGIPNLVFIDGDGHVLSRSYDDNGDYLGPRKVLADIRRHFQL